MSATATPTAAGQEAAIKTRVITHMNKDHVAELEHYLRAYNGLSAGAASGAQLTDMTLDAMTIRTASGATHTVAIAPPLANWSASRVRLVEMAGEALGRLGLSDVRVTQFRPPAGFDCVVFVSVAFYFVCAATRHLVVPGSPAWELLDAVFPFGGAVAYRWLVKAIFLPVLLIHIAEDYWMATTRLAKHRVPTGSLVWWLWIGSTFFEGVPSFKRFDRLVAEEKAKKEAQKH
ncbi:hypothetical protein BX600DRAFT_506919 [Xylariales sp. PMI_506]|nr:hypothetical protein BX600DRAFT_506919 [Xylariales sp. PMI_506]